MTSILLAILIGGAFGFVLDRVGATNPDYIIGMLRLSKLHLMKTILLAIGVAGAVVFATWALLDRRRGSSDSRPQRTLRIPGRRRRRPANYPNFAGN